MSHSASLLVASPRGFSSTSFSLGSYLLDKLQEAGYTTAKHHVQSAPIINFLWKKSYSHQWLTATC